MQDPGRSFDDRLFVGVRGETSIKRNGDTKVDGRDKKTERPSYVRRASVARESFVSATEIDKKGWVNFRVKGKNGDR